MHGKNCVKVKSHTRCYRKRCKTKKTKKTKNHPKYTRKRKPQVKQVVPPMKKKKKKKARRIVPVQVVTSDVSSNIQPKKKESLLDVLMRVDPEGINEHNNQLKQLSKGGGTQNPNSGIVPTGFYGGTTYMDKSTPISYNSVAAREFAKAMDKYEKGEIKRKPNMKTFMKKYKGKYL